VIAPQASEYSSYLVRIVAAGAIRYRVDLALAELAHLIEQNEHEGYAIGVGPLTLKEYRHNVPSERARVVGLVQTTWRLIETDSDPLPLSLDDPTVNSALARFANAPVDGYDLFLLEAMSSAGVTQILTDDGDFCCVSDIEVYTANPRVLAAAKSQGQFLSR
jgi:hypothetical protein